MKNYEDCSKEPYLRQEILGLLGMARNNNSTSNFLN
jgi:hypothetical protein